MTEVFCNDVLLNIFRHYLDTSPQFWFTLGHVCQSWRQIIFTSPLSLHLRLHCTHGKPVLKTLDYWPPLPLVVSYGGFHMHRPPAPDDEDNIMAALEKHVRVHSISLTISNTLLKRFSTIPGPFSELEELALLSQDNAQLTLPSAFWWGHRLRTLHSTRIAFPSLPQLLSPSQDLVDLQLHEIPGLGYFSPEAFADALCGMTQLRTLSLYFLSLPPRRHRDYLRLPPPPGDRVVLPALTCFKYRGISKYLDSLVARIDTPRLIDIDTTLFNQPTLDTSQLSLFVKRIEMQKSPHRADILSSSGTISIAFTQPGTVTKLELKISCELLDWQLSSICQICDNFSLLLFCVEDLGIDATGSSGVPDDMDAEQWVRLILAFRSAKNFRVAGERATDILGALCSADEETVLPALRSLRVQERMSMFNFEPLRNSVGSFVTQRRLSGHPVQLSYSESRYTCQICCIGFRLWQDFIRHLKDKHPHQNMCPYCGIFQWPQEQNHLFQEHLENEHPEVPLTDALILNPDLESFLAYSHDPAQRPARP
jgi:hypothetical protein